MLYNINSLEFICFKIFENTNKDNAIPKLTNTTGQQTVHHTRLIGLNNHNETIAFFTFLFSNVKYRNNGISRSNIIFSITMQLYDILVNLKNEPKITIYGIKKGNNST